MGKDRQLLAAAARLRTFGPTEDTRELAEALLIRLRFPMAKILEKVPGEGPTAKAKQLGVSRTAFYGWLQGKTRPRSNEAKKIAEATGYPIRAILGLPE
jgi:transcriptional regulator with XRE-family HTH domain